MTTQVEPPILKKLQSMEDRYKVNLDFFKNSVPAIFKQIDDNDSQPSLTIDKTTYKAHRMENNSPVYQGDPVQHAMDEVAEFYALMEKKVYAPPPINLVLTHLIKKKPFTKTAKLYEEITQKIGRDNLKPAVKDLFVFGIGMGYHIEILCNRRSFKNITIIENDMKNLKASMYCIDWATILTTLDKNTSVTLHISKGPDHQDAFEATLRNHCHRLFPTIGYSTLIYNHKPDSEGYQYIKDIIDEYSTHIKVSAEMIGPEAQRLFNANENIKNGYSAIDLDKSLISNGKILTIVGAGPSLDRYIDIIQENRDKFFLISAGSSLSSLTKLNVFPDIHFELEYQNLATVLLNHVNSDTNLSNLDLICTFEANPGFPKLFKNAYMFIPESSELQSLFGDPYTLRRGGITCSNGATAFACRVTDSDIHLVGLDFAYTGGKHHSETNVSMNEDLPDNLKRVNTVMKARPAYIPNKGTQGDTVFTSVGLNSARMSMEVSLKIETNKIYNCSYGANIEGTEFLSEKNLEEKLININNNLKSKLKGSMTKPNKQTVHDRTKTLLEKSLEMADNILLYVDKLGNSAEENSLAIIKLFMKIESASISDRGQLRNIYSVSKMPLLQLFLILNNIPDNEQNSVIKSWKTEYNEYVKHIKKIFDKACKSNDYLVEEDWHG